jgi:hypothetical protein
MSPYLPPCLLVAYSCMVMISSIVDLPRAISKVEVVERMPFLNIAEIGHNSRVSLYDHRGSARIKRPSIEKVKSRNQKTGNGLTRSVSKPADPVPCRHNSYERRRLTSYASSRTQISIFLFWLRNVCCCCSLLFEHDSADCKIGVPELN